MEALYIRITNTMGKQSKRENNIKLLEEERKKLN